MKDQKITLFVVLSVMTLCGATPRLVKDSSSSATYLIIDGKKSLIQNTQSFFTLIDSFNKVTVISNVNLYRTGPSIDKNAQLIKRKDSNEVYLTQYGIKRWITSVRTFNDLGLSWIKILTVQPCFFQLFKNGPRIS